MPRAEGIDLSAHEAETPSLEKLDFVFIRATYGIRPDGRYYQHLKAAKKAGLVTGAYHFGTASHHGYVQANAFLNATDSTATPDFYVLDLEKEVGLPRMTDDDARAFIHSVQAQRKDVGLYHSLHDFPHLGQNWNWVAFWSDIPPAISWKFWQYHGGPLDLDRFNGNRAALLTFAGRPPIVKPRPLIVYRVRSGDSLSKIALIWNVPGGWHSLYNLNRAKIGSNPNLIHPGILLKLPAGSHR